ncbi:outer membrane immunogenic protein [Nitrobacteraceae bacterium AZCC 1564]
MKLKLIALALLATTSIASAADLGARTYTKAPALAPAPVSNWSGFYVGVMGGYAWSDQVSVGGLTTSSSDLKGGFGGGTIGYNWQVGPSWLFGIEVDAAGADIKYSETDPGLGVTARDKINALGSVTGRLGYAVNNALLYVKGGYAWANNELSLTDGVTTFSDTKLHSGYTIGGGLEYMFAPSWSAKVEYMYADFGHQDYFSAIVPNAELGATVHTVKGGINYHFNWGGPLVAKY